jgi:hypothetical protein
MKKSLVQSSRLHACALSAVMVLCTDAPNADVRFNCKTQNGATVTRSEGCLEGEETLGFVASKTPRNATITTEDKRIDSPKYKLRATQLVDEFRVNEVKAHAKYVDSYVELTGVFNSSALAFMDKPYIVIDSKNGTFTQSGVQCFFDEGWMKAIGNLNSGEQVTVNGKVTGKEFTMVQVKLCSLH